jgi:multiple sugar transport system permease protein
MSEEKTPSSERWLLYGLMALALVGILFPFYWIIVTSLKNSNELLILHYPTWVPHTVSAHSYQEVFQERPFQVYLWNSFLVASITTVFCLLVGAMCSFATARLKFPGKDLVLTTVLAVSMFPPISVVSPLFLVLKTLHLLNTYAALIIPYTCFGLPLTIWTLHSFFKDLPNELLESARVDGASYITAFARIVLPLAGPGIFTCAILVFIGAWNEFIFALVFITSDPLRTVPVGVTLYPGQYDTPWGTVFAAATLVTLPLVFMVFAFQRYIISGLTAGAVKG